MPSARAKDMVWKGFSNGQIQILVATDAAGMGCNVPDVVYTIVFGCLKTFSSVAQRWGRWDAPCDCGSVHPSCSPLGIPSVPPRCCSILAATARTAEDTVETKADVAKQGALDKPLLKFLTLKQDSMFRYSILLIYTYQKNLEHCCHRFFCESFRPDTGLTIYDGFHSTVPTGSGSRASAAPYQMTWITLPPDPACTPPRKRCCDLCNPTYAQKYCAADPKDPQLYRYAADFIYPAATPPSRPSSSLSIASDASQHSTSSYYCPHTAYQERGLPKSEIQRFQTELEEQRELMWRAHGSSPFLSPDVFLPPKQLNALIKAAPKFAKQTTTNVKSVLAVIKLDFVSKFNLMELARAISEWCECFPSFLEHQPLSIALRKSLVSGMISVIFSCLRPTASDTTGLFALDFQYNRSLITINACFGFTLRPRPNFKSSGGPEASSTPYLDLPIHWVTVILIHISSSLPHSHAHLLGSRYQRLEAGYSHNQRPRNYLTHAGINIYNSCLAHATLNPSQSEPIPPSDKLTILCDSTSAFSMEVIYWRSTSPVSNSSPPPSPPKPSIAPSSLLNRSSRELNSNGF
ncbi:hypothetical protein CPB85DRAFT_1435111 [Mucidula mucida]|nr:hypothetical protein CPB85DRAFT_1435111 [Mucidula mucida]